MPQFAKDPACTPRQLAVYGHMLEKAHAYWLSGHRIEDACIHWPPALLFPRLVIAASGASIIVFIRGDADMPETVAKPELVAYCGLYCGACPSYTKGKCKGCHENAKATWCTVRSCCIENGFSSCAECRDHSDPNDCKRFNNFMSKLFGFVFKSDRAACIAQIRQSGIVGHAEIMAGKKMHTIKRQT